MWIFMASAIIIQGKKDRGKKWGKRKHIGWLDFDLFWVIDLFLYFFISFSKCSTKENVYMLASRGNDREAIDRPAFSSSAMTCILYTFSSRFHAGGRVNSVAEETVTRHFRSDNSRYAGPRVEANSDANRLVWTVWYVEGFHAGNQIQRHGGYLTDVLQTFESYRIQRAFYILSHFI